MAISEHKCNQDVCGKQDSKMSPKSLAPPWTPLAQSPGGWMWRTCLLWLGYVKARDLRKGRLSGCAWPNYMIPLKVQCFLWVEAEEKVKDRFKALKGFKTLSRAWRWRGPAAGNVGSLRLLSVIPDWQLVRKRGPQSCNHKEMNSASNRAGM